MLMKKRIVNNDADDDHGLVFAATSIASPS